MQLILDKLIESLWKERGKKRDVGRRRFYSQYTPAVAQPSSDGTVQIRFFCSEHMQGTDTEETLTKTDTAPTFVEVISWCQWRSLIA
jgi:hypothetical protein